MKLDVWYYICICDKTCHLTKNNIDTFCPHDDSNKIGLQLKIITDLRTFNNLRLKYAQC
jgi:hypothetical protein